MGRGNTLHRCPHSKDTSTVISFRTNLEILNIAILLKSFNLELLNCNYKSASSVTPLNKTSIS